VPARQSAATKRPDARARETRLHNGVLSRVPATFKTNVMGFSKAAAKVSGSRGRSREV
jgi:hypothetical protein